MHKKEDRYDFRAFGLAIKVARGNKQGLTREQVGAMIEIDLSTDEFFLSAPDPAKSTRRRQLEKQLDNLSDRDLVIVESVTDGTIKSKEVEEK
ncbi:XRE family transcriptional regulator [Lachnospiraceae bacterium 42-17]